MTDKPIDPNAAPQGASEASTGGPADLDAFTAEWDKAIGGEGKPEIKSSAPLKVLTKLKPVIQFAEARMAKEAKDEIDTSIKSAVDFVKEEEVIKDLPDTVVRAMLNSTVIENPKLLDAWNGRTNDPKAWNAALQEARKIVTENLKPVIEKRVPSDINAARAAISGVASTQGETPTGPTPAEKFRMSEREWRDYTRGLAVAKG